MEANLFRTILFLLELKQRNTSKLNFIMSLMRCFDIQNRALTLRDALEPLGLHVAAAKEELPC